MDTGICLDTAHVVAYGYDIRTDEGMGRMLEEMRRAGGRNRVSVIHANDSRTQCGSHHDRHAHIGRGTIGAKGFRRMMSVPHFRRLPWILETPKETEESDARNRRELLRYFGSLPAERI